MYAFKSFTLFESGWNFSKRKKKSQLTNNFLPNFLDAVPTSALNEKVSTYMA